MRLFAPSLTLLLFAAPVAFATGADNLDDVFQQLKEAQSKHDAAAVKKLAAELHGIASELIASPAPADPDEKQAWTARVENAKAADLFGEYALYATAIKSEPAAMADLLSALEQQNPKSRYLDDVYGPYLVALTRSGGASRCTAVADSALANFPENEDLLLFLVDNANSRKQSDRALAYATRLIAVMTRHPKPQTVAAADWEKKKTLALAHAYWTSGIVYAEKGRYVDADKSLRAAMPLIRDNDAMLAPALFHLGVSNYQLGRIQLSKARVLEGATYSDRCAALDSPYADQARRNALIMRQEAQKIR